MKIISSLIYWIGLGVDMVMVGLVTEKSRFSAAEVLLLSLIRMWVTRQTQLGVKLMPLSQQRSNTHKALKETLLEQGHRYELQPIWHERMASVLVL